MQALCGQVGPWQYFPGLPKVHPPHLRFGNRMPVMLRGLSAPVSEGKLALGILVLCQVGFTLQDSFCRRLVGFCLPSICPSPDLGVRSRRWHLVLLDVPPGSELSFVTLNHSPPFSVGALSTCWIFTLTSHPLALLPSV